jgi:hypothetical protein
MILLGKKEKENCIREPGDRMLKIAPMVGKLNKGDAEKL